MISDSRAVAVYAWTNGGDRALEALSITLVQPATSETIQRLHPKRLLGASMTIVEAGDTLLRSFPSGSLLVQTDELGGCSVLIEPVGWAAATPEVLIDLSIGGWAVNVFWNVNALMHFGYARDGSMLREFDPLLYDDPEAPLDEERGLPFGDPGEALAAAFVLAERISGVRVEREWLLDRRRPTHEVPVP